MSYKNLIIDIGNTNAKLVVFEGNQIASFDRTVNRGVELIDKLRIVLSHHKDCRCIISSVLEEEVHLIDFLKQNTLCLIQFTKDTALPISLKYDTPKTLGNDRIAGAAAAHNIFPDCNVLVIDAGTAITYDFVDASGRYCGGNIAPGIRLRFDSLHQFTSKLPLVQPSETYLATGTSTETAIRGGVQMGILFEIEGYIQHYKARNPDLKVILTGGDAFYFAEKLKNTIFAEPNLVPIGLNSILSYYNEKIF